MTIPLNGSARAHQDVEGPARPRDVGILAMEMYFPQRVSEGSTTRPCRSKNAMRSAFQRRSSRSLMVSRRASTQLVLARSTWRAATIGRTSTHLRSPVSICIPHTARSHSDSRRLKLSSTCSRSITSTPCPLAVSMSVPKPSSTSPRRRRPSSWISLRRQATLTSRVLIRRTRATAPLRPCSTQLTGSSLPLGTVGTQSSLAVISPSMPRAAVGQLAARVHLPCSLALTLRLSLSVSTASLPFSLWLRPIALSGGSCYL